MAMHDKLACLFNFLKISEMPCVVLWEGCNARNVASVLVHESIHHALLWLDGELNSDDGFDKVCLSLREQQRIGI